MIYRFVRTYTICFDFRIEKNQMTNGTRIFALFFLTFCQHQDKYEIFIKIYDYQRINYVIFPFLTQLRRVEIFPFYA